MNLEQAMQRIEKLELELALTKRNLINEKQRLKEIIGAWRRKAEEKGINKEMLREGYSAVTGMHYKVYSIALPGDLPVIEILDYLKQNILPSLYPYTFKKLDYVPKKREWIFEVEMDLAYDIRLEEEFLRKYYENNPY